MQIITHSGRDACYEDMLDSLTQRVYGFSFKPFFDLTGWPDAYESHSIVEDGRMLSNVCAYRMMLRIDGRDVAVRQLGAVMTLPERRREGLAAKLMRHLMERFGDTPCILFANDSVIDFYPRFGFTRVLEHSYEMPLAVNNSSARSVKIAYDDPRVAQMLCENTCFSERFDAVGAQFARLYNLMVDFQDDIYAAPDRGLLVAARQERDALLVAGVVSSSPCSLRDVIALLPFDGVARVRFGFCPDCLGVPLEDARSTKADSLFFTNKPSLFPEHFVFPMLCIT